MKYGLHSVIAFAAVLVLSSLSHGQSAPEPTSVRQEIREFQDFFRQRFPSLALSGFNNGTYSLPQSAGLKTGWDMLMNLPPYEHAMVEARAKWHRQSDGGSLAQCMSVHPSANRFPFVVPDGIVTAEQAVARCLKRLNGSSYRLDRDELLALVAVFREQSGNRSVNVDIKDPLMQRMYLRGRTVFWSRRGQNNFSCATCHVNNAGNRLRGEVLSAALGHTTGFPLYSLSRLAGNGESAWLSLHDQYAACYTRSGAVPPPPDHADLLSLQIYQTMNDTGVTLRAPGLRL